MEITELVENFEQDTNFISVEIKKNTLQIVMKDLIFSSQMADLKKIKNDILITVNSFELNELLIIIKSL